jgi:hypothetical protein
VCTDTIGRTECQDSEVTSKYHGSLWQLTWPFKGLFALLALQEVFLTEIMLPEIEDRSLKIR